MFTDMWVIVNWCLVVDFESFQCCHISSCGPFERFKVKKGPSSATCMKWTFEISFVFVANKSTKIFLVINNKVMHISCWWCFGVLIVSHLMVGVVDVGAIWAGELTRDHATGSFQFQCRSGSNDTDGASCKWLLAIQCYIRLKSLFKSCSLVTSNTGRGTDIIQKGPRTVSEVSQLGILGWNSMPTSHLCWSIASLVSRPLA